MVKYTYDARGNHTVSGSNTTLGNLNLFRYRSYFYDTETKLYYLKTRYHDPEVGRFINMDGIQYADPETVNGLNLYVYCGNNPVMGYDPEGTWSWKSFWKVVGAVAIVAATSFIAVATAGTAVGLISAGAAVGGALGGAINGISNAYLAAKNGGDFFEAFADGLFSGTVTGALSGAVAASPVGLGGQVVFNSLLSGGQYLVESALSGNGFSATDFFVSLFSGTIAGFAGGAGSMAVGGGLGATFALKRVLKSSLSKSILAPIAKSSIGSIVSAVHSILKSI